jgi:hypothetical protein
MKTHAVAWLVATALVLGAGPVLAKKYTIEDLEALANSESWDELVSHLEDIAPAKRDKKWQGIAEKGAIGYVKNYKTDKNPLGGLFAADGLTKRYGLLKKSKPFMSLRAEVGLKGFEACFDMSWSGAECGDRFLPFIEADQGNAELAQKAAQLIIRKQFAYFSIPYYKLAVDWGKASKKVCTTPRLAEAVAAALGLPSDNKLVQPAQAVAEACFDHLKEGLTDKFAEGNSYFVENSCPLLKKKKALTKTQEAKCGGSK